MSSVIDYFSGLLHKPLGALTLIDVGAVILTYLVLTFGITAVITLLSRAK